MIPSIKTLQQIPGVDRAKAHKLRLMLEGNLKPRDVSPACDMWVRQCFNAPSTHEQVLAAANEIIGGHGVESLNRCESDYHTDDGVRFCPPYSYVNLGDPYICTLMRNHTTGRYIVSSWGDIAERLEK